jgi:hypothetical protein
LYLPQYSWKDMFLFCFNIKQQIHSKQPTHLCVGLSYSRPLHSCHNQLRIW